MHCMQFVVMSLFCSFGQQDVMASDQKEEGSAGVGNAKSYFVESIAELKKVTTPTRQEAMQATIVTLIIIAFMSLCLFSLDFIFHTLVSFLIK